MPSCAPKSNPKSLICTVKEIRQWTDYYDNPWFYHNLLCQLTLKDSEISCWIFGYCNGWEVTDGKVGVSCFRCGLYSEWVTIDLGTEKWKWGGTFYDWTEWFTLSMLPLGKQHDLLNLRKWFVVICWTLESTQGRNDLTGEIVILLLNWKLWRFPGHFGLLEPWGKQRKRAWLVWLTLTIEEKLFGLHSREQRGIWMELWWFLCACHITMYSCISFCKRLLDPSRNRATKDWDVPRIKCWVTSLEKISISCGTGKIRGKYVCLVDGGPRIS